MTKNFFHFWFATWFGTGLAPKAPGTAGTLATVPLHFLLIQLPPAAHLIFLIGFVGIATWSANRLAADMQMKDPQIVVVDESAGVLIALFLMGPTTLWTVIAAVVLYGFGTGPIKGFAVTLSIGIVTSMFTAIVVTRAIVNLIYGGKRVERLAI